MGTPCIIYDNEIPYNLQDNENKTVFLNTVFCTTTPSETCT